MFRQETSVLLPIGRRRRLSFTQRAHESGAEFDGRVLCAIEDRIRANGGQLAPGLRWAEWHHTGHPLRRFHANGLGSVREHTGNRYADRTVIIPGLYDLETAKLAIR